MPTWNEVADWLEGQQHDGTDNELLTAHEVWYSKWLAQKARIRSNLEDKA